MFSNALATTNANFSMPLNLGSGGAQKDLFNVTSSGDFDPPPPPGGPGAPFSPLFNQPVFNLVPAITIDLSFFYSSSQGKSFSPIREKNSFLSGYDFNYLHPSAISKTVIWAYPVFLPQAFLALDAAKRGDIAALQKLVDQGINFHEAVQYNHELLLRLNANKLISDTQSISFLKDAGIPFSHKLALEAAMSGQLDVLRFLEEKCGLNLRAVTDCRSLPPLPIRKYAQASLRNSLSAIAYAISEEALHRFWPIRPLVQIAAQNGNVEMLNYLTEGDFLDSEKAFYLAFRALLGATETNALRVVEWCNKYKPSISIAGRVRWDIAKPLTVRERFEMTLSHLAALLGRVDILRFLRTDGVNFASESAAYFQNEYCSPTDFAAKGNQPAVMRYLHQELGMNIKRSFKTAVRNKAVAVLEYYVEQSIPDPDTAKKALEDTKKPSCSIQ